MSLESTRSTSAESTTTGGLHLRRSSYAQQLAENGTRLLEAILRVVGVSARRFTLPENITFTPHPVKDNLQGLQATARLNDQ